jgi:hypothetical protein
MSGAGGYGVSVFGLEIIAAQFDLITKEAIPHNAQLALLFLAILLRQCLDKVSHGFTVFGNRGFL